VTKSWPAPVFLGAESWGADHRVQGHPRACRNEWDKGCPDDQDLRLTIEWTATCDGAHTALTPGGGRGDGSGRSRSACGKRKQLADEGLRQPLLVPVGAPASVTDEQPVDLGQRERVNDVRGVALAQLRA
jgi:hypothetical protein